jgi:hypothetical protein
MNDYRFIIRLSDDISIPFTIVKKPSQQKANEFKIRLLFVVLNIFIVSQ